MWRIATGFVPRLLSSDQKEYCIAFCTELKEQAENDPNLISNIITGDESLVFGCDAETKKQSSQWKTPASPQLKKAQQAQSNVKWMLFNFFYIEGIVHKEFVPLGQTVNGKLYCDVRRWLRENIWCTHPDKWHNNSWFLHHDSTPAYASLVVLNFLASMNSTVIPHPLCSLDLVPFDFFSYSQRWNWSSRGDVTELKRSRLYSWMWWRRWREMTPRSASDHKNPAGIAVSMPKGTTLKGNWGL